MSLEFLHLDLALQNHQREQRAWAIGRGTEIPLLSHKSLAMNARHPETIARQTPGCALRVLGFVRSGIRTSQSEGQTVRRS
jgi:hypothetical protein